MSERTWDPERCVVGAEVVIDHRYPDNLRVHRVTRVTATQAVLEGTTYRLNRQTGEIRGALRHGPHRAWMVTDADRESALRGRLVRHFHTVQWSKLSTEQLEAVARVLSAEVAP